MFLIIAKWQDDSDMIFVVGNDPENNKMPHWVEVFQQLDTVADPSDAILQFAKVSREFRLMREADGEFSVSDDRTYCDLMPLKLSPYMTQQWYDLLRKQGLEIEDEPDF